MPTVGCRRCGGGLAGAVGISNVLAGARLAEALDPDLARARRQRRRDPAGRRRAAHPRRRRPPGPAVATGYLNPYRALLADLVVVTMAEDDIEHGALAAALGELTRPGVPIVQAVLRPRPLDDVRGRRIAFFGAAPSAQHDRIATHLTEYYGATVTHVSGQLSDRSALRTELATLDADAVVVEVKAAAIDVVAEEAARLEIPVVLAANDVVPLPGGPDLDDIVERLAGEAISAAMVGV